MSKVRRKSDNIPNQTIKEIHNPFSELSQASIYERHTKKSTKISKRAGKCFQLVLICQKLLKPFSSSNKTVQSNISKQNHFKEKSSSTQEINRLNRTNIETTVPYSEKVDACVQTNKESLPDISQLGVEDDDDTNQCSEDFTYDVDESLKEPYWDLDIDSAIVGDFNSMSTFSLNEQIDPHYTIIKMTSDGRVIDQAQCAAEQTFYTSIYHDEKASCSNSNMSSPKSGVYSKINKPRKLEADFNSPMSDYYRLRNGTRLNFDKILAIRNQLGRSRDLDQSYPGSECSVTTTNDPLYATETPDIPRREYGSSVINYISQLRQHDSYQHSSCNPTLVYQNLSTTNIYSPIWNTERGSSNHKISELPETPASEPTVPKRSINKILHQLNPTYADDSSEDASIISINSPTKITYTYPRYFSDNYSHKSSVNGWDCNNYTNMLNHEINRFRHMDSELDVTDRYRPLPYQTELNGGMFTVPLMDIRCGDMHLFCDDKMCLQPLMERSCEEEYFKRDILSSLDYISV